MLTDDTFLFDPLAAADGEEKVAILGLKTLGRSGARMTGMRTRAGAKAGLSPFMSNMGARRGALYGAAGGAALGALKDERDPETGEKKGLLSRMAGGAGKGAVVGGAAGLATRKLYTDPKLKARAPKATGAKDARPPTQADRMAKARADAAASSPGFKTPGGEGASTMTRPAATGRSPTGQPAMSAQGATPDWLESAVNTQTAAQPSNTNTIDYPGSLTMSPQKQQRADQGKRNPGISSFGAAAFLDPIFADPLAAALGYTKIAEYEAAPDDDNMGHDLPPAAHDDAKEASFLACLPGV